MEKYSIGLKRSKRKSNVKYKAKIRFCKKSFGRNIEPVFKADCPDGLLV